jgi:hypothetical protein
MSDRGESRRRLPTASALLILVWLLPCACKREPVRPHSDPAAVALLERMMAAEDKVSYRAVNRMQMSWGRGEPRPMEQSVTHYAGGATIYESNGGWLKRHVTWRNRIYWLGNVEQLEENYGITLDGETKVLGRDASRIRIAADREDRPSMHLTVDSETGLLLAADTIDWEGRSTVHWEFTSLEIDPKLPPPPEKSDREFEEVQKPATDDLGFPPMFPRWLPAGFRETGRYRWDRPEGMPGLHRPGRSDGPQLKTTYSDGLAWFQLSQWKAPKGAEELVARQSKFGSRSSIRVVISGVGFWIEGPLRPEDLQRVLQSLAPPKAQ